MFTDSHCHLYDEIFSSQLRQIIENAYGCNVGKIIMPAISSESHNSMLAIADKYPNNVFAMMGLHPCYVKENYKEELLIVKNYLQTHQFVAIGEIGLDKHWDTTFYKQQIEAFEQQMEWAIQYGYNINIHTRNATQETIEIVKPFAQKGLKGIFHCFGGSYETAKQILDLNFILGIGGVVTYKNAGLQDVLNKLSPNNLVLETDAPYLTPIPHRGKTNFPEYVKIIAEKITTIMNCTLEELLIATNNNIETIYKMRNNL